MWVGSILVQRGEHCAKEHKAGASSIVMNGQYCSSSSRWFFNLVIWSQTILSITFEATIEYLAMQCWPNLLWVWFYKNLHVTVLQLPCILVQNIITIFHKCIQKNGRWRLRKFSRIQTLSSVIFPFSPKTTYPFSSILCNDIIACFSFFRFLALKMLKINISASIWSVQHTNAGGIIQQWAN